MTFDRSVNIKEICWNLQNIRVSAGHGAAGSSAGSACPLVATSVHLLVSLLSEKLWGWGHVQSLWSLTLGEFGFNYQLSIGPSLEGVASGAVIGQLVVSLQLRECELSPGVNRDLTRRVRNINGITQHKQIVRNDIKLAAKLIHTLDDRTQLWASEPGTPPVPTVGDSQGLFPVHPTAP